MCLTSMTYRQQLLGQKAAREGILLPTWPREPFSIKQRSSCNVSGVCGKGKLDIKRIKVIKRTCFEMFPLTNPENHHKAWQDCVKAVDSAGRTVFRRMKENKPWDYYCTFWVYLCNYKMGIANNKPDGYAVRSFLEVYSCNLLISLLMQCNSQYHWLMYRRSGNLSLINLLGLYNNEN